MTRTGRWITEHLVMAIALLVLGYMFLPIFFVVLMSFNDPTSRLNYEFQAFTWDNWLNPCAPAGMCESVVKSIEIGFLATLFATILGYMSYRNIWASAKRKVAPVGVLDPVNMAKSKRASRKEDIAE